MIVIEKDFHDGLQEAEWKLFRNQDHLTFRLFLSKQKLSIFPDLSIFNPSRDQLTDSFIRIKASGIASSFGKQK